MVSSQHPTLATLLLGIELWLLTEQETGWAPELFWPWCWIGKYLILPLVKPQSPVPKTSQSTAFADPYHPLNYNLYCIHLHMGIVICLVSSSIWEFYSLNSPGVTSLQDIQAESHGSTAALDLGQQSFEEGSDVSRERLQTRVKELEDILSGVQIVRKNSFSPVLSNF